MDITEKLFNDIINLPEVEAIALGGSRAGNAYDEKSDYDVYVYVTENIPENKRREILARYCTVAEIGNHYWETEDNCTLIGGIDIDIIYRSLDDFAAGISQTVDKCEATNSYTTCMWHNLLNCKIIFDKNGRLSELQKRYNIPYPKALRENIIERNMKLLSGALPSYDMQIKKAAGRRDTVSINHRTTEFLASYFNVIFAMNNLTHPGEKRLVQLCKERCKILPNNFEENLNELFAEMFSGDVSEPIKKIVNELKITLKNEGGIVMTTVYFVRHAKPDKTVHDDRTRPLTAEGLADSEKVAELLKNKNIDLIMSSPYKRSMDTVDILAKALNKEILTDDDFRERNAGSWFGDNFLEFIEKQWEDFNYHILDGECLASVQERNIRALKKVLAEHSGKTIVIATHGTALSTIINYFDPAYNFKSFMRILNFMPYVVKMEFEGERFLGMSEELIIEKNW